MTKNVNEWSAGKKAFFPGLLLAGLLLLSPGVTGAEELFLDRDEALEIALANNPGIRSQELDTGIAERNFAHRFNVFIPSISAQGTLARPNKAPELPALAPPETPEPPRWNLSSNLSAQLTLAPQMYYGIRAVTDTLQNAVTDLDEVRRRLELDVNKAFNQALLLREQLALTERRIAAAEERLAEIEGNYRAGLVDELTLRRTQVAIENQRPGLLRQRQAMDTAARNLAFTLGMNDGRLVYPLGEINSVVIQADERLAELIDRSADLQGLRQAAAGLQTQMDLTRSQMLPTLTLAFSLSPALTGDPFSDDLLEADNWNDRGSFSLTLRQPIDPILPGSNTRKDLANQQDQLNRLDIQKQQVRNAVRLQLQQLIAGTHASRDTIASLQGNIDLAERAFVLAEEAFAAGLRDYSVVRDAEIDMADARLQLLQEEHRYADLLLDLEFLLNTELEQLIEMFKENE